ncbi:unnamed protein product [Prorocentrum cordatum]|uniref:Uncharacterized protein n=1 Tax=Prorocentrum cordatum TaxID=2364126 RepID=A0ABN9R788_9DINO|nr:unnamed protein product [Polarella glacialis]
MHGVFSGDFRGFTDAGAGYRDGALPFEAALHVRCAQRLRPHSHPCYKGRASGRAIHKLLRSIRRTSRWVLLLRAFERKGTNIKYDADNAVCLGGSWMRIWPHDCSSIWSSYDQVRRSVPPQVPPAPGVRMSRVQIQQHVLPNYL